MTDVTSRASTLFLRDEELRRGCELLYFAYRDFTADPDAILDEHMFGRAHHRVVHFVARKPGMPVSELLNYLRITKQSLSRVLGQLIDEGYIEQRPGASDRRQRLLFLTDKGLGLEQQLSKPQRERMARAYREAGGEAVAGFWKVLLAISNPKERAAIEAMINRS